MRRKLNIDRIASHIGCHFSTKLSKVIVHCFAHFVYPKLRLNCLIAYIKYFVTFFRILLKLQYNCWERLLISNDISFYLFTDNEVFSLITCCAARVLRQFGAVIQFLRETIIHIKCASVGSFSPACRQAFLLIKTVCKNFIRLIKFVEIF